MKQKTPPVDIRKVIRAAAEAALEEPTDAKPKKRRHSSGRVMKLGLGLITAGGLLAGARGRDVLGSLQESLGSLQESLGGLGEKLSAQNAVGADLEDEEFEEPVADALDEVVEPEDELKRGTENQGKKADKPKASARAPRRRAPSQRRAASRR